MIKRQLMTAAIFAAAVVAMPPVAHAQPAKGAAASVERVREVTASRFKDMKLTGDPDQDFATMLLAHHENMIYLAKVQLEFGGDRELRQAAQKIVDEQQKRTDEIKQWQVRTRRPSYEGRPSQSPVAASPPVQMAQPAPVPAAPSQPAAQAQATLAPARDLPTVSGTVEKVDSAAGKITIDHGPIPNLNMEQMTMVFRAGDPAMLKQVRQGDKVRFSADRVNGQLTVTKMQKER
jgi:Cu/Ag efflux protein CusF